MKLERFLSIGSKVFDVADEDVLLEANAAGRASFTVDTAFDVIKPFSPVSFDIGYSQHDHLSRLFLGFVESVTPVDSRRAVLFCREFSAVLAHPLPISLRHPSMRDVLAAIETKAGLNFSVPSVKYAQVKIPHFCNVASGFLALTCIGRSFKISDFFWQQQADGAVFVGSWGDSPWPDRETELPTEWFTDQFANSAKIPALPSLRPGALLNGQRVDQVRLQGNFMFVSFVDPS